VHTYCTLDTGPFSKRRHHLNIGDFPPRVRKSIRLFEKRVSRHKSPKFMPQIMKIINGNLDCNNSPLLWIHQYLSGLFFPERTSPNCGKCALTNIWWIAIVSGERIIGKNLRERQHLSGASPLRYWWIPCSLNQCLPSSMICQLFLRGWYEVPLVRRPVQTEHLGVVASEAATNLIK
jgi:hypothetical protein